MPQLDIYIICNLVFSVILLLIIIYLCNVEAILLRINITLRIRRLKIFIEKKYIFKMLKEIMQQRKLKYIVLVLERTKKYISLLKKYIFVYDFLDIKINETKILLRKLKYKFNNNLKIKLKKIRKRKKLKLNKIKVKIKKINKKIILI